MDRYRKVKSAATVFVKMPDNTAAKMQKLVYHSPSGSSRDAHASVAHYAYAINPVQVYFFVKGLEAVFAVVIVYDLVVAVYHDRQRESICGELFYIWDVSG